LADFKAGVAGEIQPGSFQTLDETARRLLGSEPRKKAFDAGARAFDLEAETLRGIAHPSGQTEVCREAEDKGAKSHTLNGAANSNL
jgi:hypothetical protein